MAAPFPSSSRMDAWPQRRGLQTMNLRSVFTAEQQRILERYYENGMTNQSKACFQLILQCAQEAKLDFSVVRTWVGNKRRKLASKVDQNGGASHSLSSHGLAGGLLSNHTLAGGALSNQCLAAGALLPADMAAARNIQNRVHLLPPSTSFPSFSSTSSSPSSSSPLSSGSNNNNDVILTGIYSLNSVPRARQTSRPTAPPPQLDSELSAHTSSSLINQVLQSRNSSTSSPVHSKLVSLSQNLPSLTSASGPIVYTAVRKGTLSLGEGGISAGAGVVPHSWTRQYGTAQTRPWSSSSQSQAQLQPRPHSNPQPQPPPPQKTRASLPAQNSGSSSEQTPRIQQVFTLSGSSEGDRLRPGPSSALRGQETHRPARRPLGTSHDFSIAMETGDEENEWQREEELANMAAQTHIHREQTSASPTGDEVSVVSHTPPMTSPRPAVLHSNTTLQGSYSLTAQTSLTGESSSQSPVNMSAAPWVISNSRKRTLQDRTQFSDGDLIQLKRYWDRGMTSLGSVCREKITAAANQLSVDTEIVKTWISNRRRKYRLMGIEIPPPKGGPAVFTSSSPGNESPVALSPDEERLRTPELADDLNDEGSVCSSEDGTIDSQHRDGEDGTDMSAAAPLANNVKIEVIDEDEEADDDEGELVASDLEQMQNLLEFKHEEVQFLENELENQKQKYQELVSFTKSLLSAVRNNDLQRQQELIASLPQPSDQDWDMTVERGAQLDSSFIHNDPQTAGVSGTDPPRAQANDEVPLVTVNEDDTTSEATEPSASEEQLQEAVTEQE
ncbi:highly divergent homeobox isoform X2 [Mugil cephalus]|uniref:highly divergent homeobox isoform X2 n=1 Tax=Mugil cephalus TaxID=48193 RepID=UPI001FB57598|nr:highly divergent homeobox isoform X2 [Mugil cephalus]